MGVEAILEVPAREPQMDPAEVSPARVLAVGVPGADLPKMVQVED